MAYHLILASTSPRRRQFLEILGLPFSVVSPGFATATGEIDETPLPNEAPADLVQRLSRMKAKAVISHLDLLLSTLTINDKSRVVVIAADTIVALGMQILGKPRDEAEAAQILKILRRRSHNVYSGITIAYLPTKQPIIDVDSATASDNMTLTIRCHHSQVWMRPYTDTEIAAYIASGSPLDKAGAYGIQDQPFAPVEHLEGCFASVMGLPLAELAAVLTDLGIPLPNIGTVCSQHTAATCCQIGNIGTT